MKEHPNRIILYKEGLLLFLRSRQPHIDWCMGHLSTLKICEVISRNACDTVILELITEMEPIADLIDDVHLSSLNSVVGDITYNLEEGHHNYDCCVHVKLFSDRLYYQTYLKSPAWLQLRARIFRSRGFSCEICQSKKNLQLHHVTYERLGYEKDEDVMILCRKCHEKAHTNH